MNTKMTLNEQVNEIMLSKLSKRQKKEAIVKLGIRDKEADFLIKMNETFDAYALTFGVEIECYNVVRERLIEAAQRRRLQMQSQGYNHDDSRRFYKLVSDSSIRGENSCECVSPILKGASGIDSLRGVCEALNEIGAEVNKSTGLHIHFDARGISEKHFCRIVKNYRRVEKAIDSFMPESRQGNNNYYCGSLQGEEIDDICTRDGLIQHLESRYYKVNVQAFRRHGTIEFRQHSGTTDFTKIERWIFFLRKLIAFSEKNELGGGINTIEELPFLTDEDKVYFINRRTQLAN